MCGTVQNNLNSYIYAYMKTLKEVISVYKILFVIFCPFIISGLPVIPAVYFENPIYLIFMIITFPLGVVLASFLTERLLNFE